MVSKLKEINNFLKNNDKNSQLSSKNLTDNYFQCYINEQGYSE